MSSFFQRGGSWVIGQFALMGLLGVLGLATRESITFVPAGLGKAVGLLLILIACVIGIRSGRNLGNALTTLPEPNSANLLVQTGMYGIVRHPIYLAVFILTLGWSLACLSWPTLVLCPVVLAFFNAKANVEERKLSVKFSNYAAYCQRVPKLIPWTR